MSENPAIDIRIDSRTEWIGFIAKILNESCETFDDRFWIAIALIIRDAIDHGLVETEIVEFFNTAVRIRKGLTTL